MEKLQDVFTKITKLTSNIESNYPELYAFLGENPMTISTVDSPDITMNVMKEYLENLKELLKHHLETHKK